jgi:hypothetical protein
VPERGFMVITDLSLNTSQAKSSQKIIAGRRREFKVRFIAAKAQTTLYGCTT